LPELENGDWETAQTKLKNGESLYPINHVIKEPELLFAKINDRKDTSRLDLINAQKEKLAMILEAEKANDREPIKPEITFDDFTKMDLRTGTIIEAEKVKKADKLLKLTVDLGTEKRTVVSGIAKFYEAEKVIGQQVLLLVSQKRKFIISSFLKQKKQTRYHTKSAFFNLKHDNSYLPNA